MICRLTGIFTVANTTRAKIYNTIYKTLSIQSLVSDDALLTYLLIDTIVFTKHIISTKKTSNERMDIRFLVTIQPFQCKHGSFVDSSKCTQVLSMLFGGLEDVSKLVLNTRCITTTFQSISLVLMHINKVPVLTILT